MTPAGVIKEMVKPRVAMSAREDHDIVLREFPVVENNVEKRTCDRKKAAADGRHLQKGATINFVLEPSL